MFKSSQKGRMFSSLLCEFIGITHTMCLMFATESVHPLLRGVCTFSIETNLSSPMQMDFFDSFFHTPTNSIEGCVRGNQKESESRHPYTAVWLVVRLKLTCKMMVRAILHPSLSTQQLSISISLCRRRCTTDHWPAFTLSTECLQTAIF